MHTALAGVLATVLLLGSPLAPPISHAVDVCADFGGAVEQDALCRLHVTEPNPPLTV